MKLLLIATDGSAAAQVAVEDGVELARDLDGRVLFVYVKPRPSGLLGEPFYQRRLTQEAADARAAITTAMETAAKENVDCDWEILEGEPAGEIIAIASERHADLIVVGSRGFGAITGTLLGSVSRAVVHDADRPVLVARQRKRHPQLVAV